MSRIPPHIEGQYLRALSKCHMALTNWHHCIDCRSMAGPRAAWKWARVHKRWGIRMNIISPYLEEGTP